MYSGWLGSSLLEMCDEVKSARINGLRSWGMPSNEVTHHKYQIIFTLGSWLESREFFFSLSVFFQSLAKCHMMSSFLQRGIVEKFFDKVHMSKQHSPTAVSLQSQGIQGISVISSRIEWYVNMHLQSTLPKATLHFKSNNHKVGLFRWSTKCLTICTKIL